MESTLGKEHVQTNSRLSWSLYICNSFRMLAEFSLFVNISSLLYHFWSGKLSIICAMSNSHKGTNSSYVNTYWRTFCLWGVWDNAWLLSEHHFANSRIKQFFLSVRMGATYSMDQRQSPCLFFFSYNHFHSIFSSQFAEYIFQAVRCTCIEKRNNYCFRNYYSR